MYASGFLFVICYEGLCLQDLVLIFLKLSDFLHICVADSCEVTSHQVLQWNCANNILAIKMSIFLDLGPKCPFSLDFLNLGRSLTIGCFSPLSHSGLFLLRLITLTKRTKRIKSSMSSDKEVFELKVAQIRCSNF